MGLRLTPRDETFFQLLSESAQHAVEAAHELVALLHATPHDRPAIAGRLSAVEHAADEATHRIIRKVNSSFVTPFDHIDILELASALDDCTDAIEAAGDTVVLYRVGTVLPGCFDQVRLIARMAELTAEAMPRLAAMKGLSDYWVEINRLENEGDDAYRGLLKEIFSGSLTSPIDVIKHKDVVERLEQAADAFEKVAHRVEGIAIKEA